MQGLAEWSQLRKPHYALHGEDIAACQHILQALCFESAYPGSDKVLTVQEGCEDLSWQWVSSRD